MDEKWHGTSGGYTNHYCRCDGCRDAFRARMTKRRAEVKAGAPANITHGTTSSYAYGCRCRPCTDARAAYSRAAYHRRKSEVAR